MPRCHGFRHIDIYVSLLPPTNDHSVAFWTPETMTAPIDHQHPLRPPPILLRDHMIEAYPLSRILGILDLIPNYIHLSLSLLHIPLPFYLSHPSLSIPSLWQPGYRPPPLPPLSPPFNSSTRAAPSATSSPSLHKPRTKRSLTNRIDGTSSRQHT